MVRGPVRPLRPAARRARRHARLPARCRPGARRRHSPRCRACCEPSRARLRPRLTVTLRQALRRSAHRHELTRPRSRPHARLARRPDRRHGRARRPSSSCTAARSPRAPTPSALAAAYEAEHLPVGAAPRAGFVDEVVAPAAHARAPDRRAGRAGQMAVSADRESGRAPATPPRRRSSTAARQALTEVDYDALTMDAIARRAYVSPHGGLLLLPQQARARRPADPAARSRDMYVAASPYLDGEASRGASCASRSSRTVGVVNGNAHVLLLAAQLSGEHEDRCRRVGALHPALRRRDGQARIARDQQRGIAPAGHPAAHLARRRCWPWSSAHHARGRPRRRRRRTSRSACWPSCGGARCTRTPTTSSHGRASGAQPSGTPPAIVLSRVPSAEVSRMLRPRPMAR